MTRNTKKELATENATLITALKDIVAAGTRKATVRVGDMYDMANGYDEHETISEEAEIAAEALGSLARQEYSA